MPVEKTQLNSSPQSSLTRGEISQTVTPRRRTVAALIAPESVDTVHNTRQREIDRFLAVQMPPPLFMIRFR
jgi:hypothetical protein